MIMLSDIRGTTEGEVTPLIGRDFFVNMYSMLSKAEKSVLFTCFQSSSSAKKETSKTGRLLKQIRLCHERGLHVRAVVNYPRAGNKMAASNNDFINFLHDSGILYRLGRPDDTVHAKFFVIDNRILVVGSHNLTNAGLWDNYEASLAVESESAALTYISYFNYLWTRGRMEG